MRFYKGFHVPIPYIWSNGHHIGTAERPKYKQTGNMDPERDSMVFVPETAKENNLLEPWRM